MIPYRSIEQVERIETPLSSEMLYALEKWYEMYLDDAPWLEPGKVKSLNLPAFISSSKCRAVQFDITDRSCAGDIRN